MTRQEAGTMDISSQPRTDPRVLSSERFISFFARLLQAELEFRRVRGLEVAPLETYYNKTVLRDGRPCPIGLAGYSARLEPVLQEIRNLPSSAHILDAGCGFGTESVLFSFFGPEVTGIELVTERCRLASSRVNFYRDFSSGPLNLRFENAQVMRFLQRSGPFDLIWAMESISHIYPPDEFLSLVYRRLKNRGKLIISDPNRLNPSAWVKSIRIRGSIRERTHKKFADPETGVPVDVGEEIIFSVFLMAKKLAKIGFRIQKIRMSGFMGSSWLPRSLLNHHGAQKLLVAFQKSLQRTPLVRYLGSVYTIVAVKD